MDLYDNYKQLACQIIYVVVKDYKLQYKKYKKMQEDEYSYSIDELKHAEINLNREKRNFETEYMEILLANILGIRGNQLLKMLNSQCEAEIKQEIGKKRGKKKRLRR